MKNKDLIERLKQFPENMEVKVMGEYDEYYDSCRIFGIHCINNNEIWLEI